MKGLTSDGAFISARRDSSFAAKPIVLSMSKDGFQGLVWLTVEEAERVAADLRKQAELAREGMAVR